MERGGGLAGGGGRGESHRRRSRGFTIVELFVALALVGILAAVSIPNLQRLVHRSKRAEAYTTLRGIYDAQVYYDTVHRVYAQSFDQLGFSLEGGTLLADGSIRGRHYTFTLQALPLEGEPRANFRATAAGDIDGADPVLDVLVAENRLTLPGVAGAPDRVVDANEAVLVSDDVGNRTRPVRSAAAAVLAPEPPAGPGPGGGAPGDGGGPAGGGAPGGDGDPAGGQEDARAGGADSSGQSARAGKRKRDEARQERAAKRKKRQQERAEKRRKREQERAGRQPDRNRNRGGR